ncbi:MAG: multicopper oxidase domain-containing protein [Gammaproteobacteria bacterium]|nr:multicopper oxidase domain-containing protein [Gammaproteobacteria bacterium]MDH5800019.1 multicopper oxidase domain-containing protein [Gammaproteobacteria bacterium]
MVLWAANGVYAASHVFDMTIDEVTIKVAPNLDYKVFGFNGQVPGPLIHVRQGDQVTVNVTNNSSLPHTIHWHGIHQKNSWRSDGVPDVTQKQIEAGESYTYKFKADRVGSLWYHCHVNVNEHVGIRGMWGPLIVDPKKPGSLEKKVTVDAIMMLSTWESASADKYGIGGTPKDLADFFSVNGKSFPLSQPLRVKKGDVVRVRFYGAGGAIHAMHSHGHDMLVTHKDGLPLDNPYYADTILVGPGERYDVIIKANNPGRFIFHDHVDTHVTAGGKFPGGPITVMEYEGIEMEDWYVWKDKVYDPNFFYSQSLKKGYGMFDHDEFKGKTESLRRRRN